MSTNPRLNSSVQLDTTAQNVFRCGGWSSSSIVNPNSPGNELVVPAAAGYVTGPGIPRRDDGVREALQGYRQLGQGGASIGTSQDSEARLNLLKGLREDLKRYEEESGQRLKVKRELRDGAESNFHSDEKEYELSCNTFSFRGLGDWVGGMRPRYAKQVETSRGVWEEHVQKCKEQEELHQSGTKAAAEADEKLKQLEDMEKSRQRRLADLEAARASGSQDVQAKIENELQILERDFNSVLASVQSVHEKALVSLGEERRVDFAKQFRAYRDMSASFEEGIAKLDQVEGYARAGTHVIVIVGAGAVAVSTGGAGAPVLMTALYAAGLGAGGKLIINSAENVGHLTAGTQGRAWDVVFKDAAMTGVEAGVNGLGAGLAGKLFQGVSRVTAVSGQIPQVMTLGMRGKDMGIAIARSYVGATPGTIFNVGREIANKRINSPSEFLMTVCSSYATATLCSGNSYLGTSGRLIAGNSGLNALIRIPLVASSYGLEKFGNAYFATKVNDMLAAGMGVKVDAPSFQEQRRFNYLMALFGDMAGDYTARRSFQLQQQLHQKVNTVAEAADVQLAAHQQNSLLRSSRGDAALTAKVTSSNEPLTHREGRPAIKGQIEVQMHNDPRIAMTQGHSVDAQTRRAVVVHMDEDGHVANMTRASRARAGDAVDHQMTAEKVPPAKGLTGILTNIYRRVTSPVANAVGMRGLFSWEKQPVKDFLTGTDSQFKQVDSTIKKVFGTEIPDTVRERIAGNITRQKMSAEDRIAYIERETGITPTKKQQAQLEKAIKSDRVGEIEKVYIRSSQLEQNPDNLTGRARSLTADATDIVAESRNLAHRWKNGLRGVADTDSSPERSGFTGRVAKVFDYVAAPFENTPVINRLGKPIANGCRWVGNKLFVTPASAIGTAVTGSWNFMKKVPIAGQIIRFGEQSYNLASTYGFQLVNLGLSHAQPNVFVSGGFLLHAAVGLPLVGASHARRWFSYWAGLRPASPVDAFHAISLREQIDHRLTLIGEHRGKVAAIRERGGQFDRNLETQLQRAERALLDARADVQKVFNQASKRAGRIPPRSAVVDDSEGVIAVRNAIRESANAGMEYSMQGNVRALACQAVRNIREGGSIKDLQALLALGHRRVQPEAMDQLVTTLEKLIQRVPAGGVQRIAGTTASRVTGGTHSGAPPKKAHLEKVIMQYRNARAADDGLPPPFPAVKSRLRTSDKINLDTVYRGEMRQRSLQSISRWIQDDPNIDPIQAFRDLAAIDRCAITRFERKGCEKMLETIAANARARALNISITNDRKAALNRLAAVADKLRVLDSELTGLVSTPNLTPEALSAGLRLRMDQAAALDAPAVLGPRRLLDSVIASRRRLETAQSKAQKAVDQRWRTQFAAASSDPNRDAIAKAALTKFKDTKAYEVLLKADPDYALATQILESHTTFVTSNSLAALRTAVNAGRQRAVFLPHIRQYEVQGRQPVGVESVVDHEMLNYRFDPSTQQITTRDAGYSYSDFFTDRQTHYRQSQVSLFGIPNLPQSIPSPMGAMARVPRSQAPLDIIPALRWRTRAAERLMDGNP